MSERSTGLRAVALQRLVQLDLDLDLSDRQSYQLARAEDIEWVAQRLADRLRVKRTVPGESPRDDEFQISLAVAEIASELAGAPSRDRRRLRDEMMDREASLRAAVDAVEAAGEAVSEILEDLRQQANDFGRFGRFAYRLYVQQVSRLELNLSEVRARELARSRLDGIYKRYIERASNAHNTG